MNQTADDKLTMRKLLLLNPTDLDVCLIKYIVSKDWEVYVAKNANQAKDLLVANRFLVGLVLMMPHDADHNHEWIKELVLAERVIEWVALLPRKCLEARSVVTLLAERFYDYHLLPVDPDRLLVTLGHAYGMAELTERLLKQRNEAKSRFGMIGSSPAMQALFGSIEKAAGANAPVMIMGEGGTGKELAARAIHEHSARNQAPFVDINCAALPANLSPTELFSYFEAAVGGTLFLDGIGDLQAQLQVNLLRFLQKDAIRPSGAAKNPDVRVITATSIDLEQAIRDQRFRQDLYYRLNVLRLHVPSLRDRNGDVERLAHHLLDKLSRGAKRTIKGFSQDAIGLMQSYPWPGNVREMTNRIQRAVVLGDDDYLTPRDLGLERRSPKRGEITLDGAREAAERQAIQSSLRRTSNNVSQAARDLGISRVTLYRLMHKYQIGRENAKHHV